MFVHVFGGKVLRSGSVPTLTFCFCLWKVTPMTWCAWEQQWPNLWPLSKQAIIMPSTTHLQHRPCTVYFYLFNNNNNFRFLLKTLTIKEITIHFCIGFLNLPHLNHIIMYASFKMLFNKLHFILPLSQIQIWTPFK